MRGCSISTNANAITSSRQQMRAIGVRFRLFLSLLFDHEGKGIDGGHRCWQKRGTAAGAREKGSRISQCTIGVGGELRGNGLFFSPLKRVGNLTLIQLHEWQTTVTTSHPLQHRSPPLLVLRLFHALPLPFSRSKPMAITPLLYHHHVGYVRISPPAPRESRQSCEGGERRVFPPPPLLGPLKKSIF